MESSGAESITAVTPALTTEGAVMTTNSSMDSEVKIRSVFQYFCYKKFKMKSKECRKYIDVEVTLHTEAQPYNRCLYN